MHSSHLTVSLTSSFACRLKMPTLANSFTTNCIQVIINLLRAKYCHQRVGLSLYVCAQTYLKNQIPELTRFGCCNSVAWQRRETLYTSGFVDDVIFSPNGLYGAARAYNSRKYTASISTKFWSTMKTSKYTHCRLCTGSKYVIYDCLF